MIIKIAIYDEIEIEMNLIINEKKHPSLFIVG